MSKLQGEVLTLPKMSGSVSTPKSLSGNVGAKTINIGQDGATFIPSVSSDGVLSWTNDKELPNPDPVNIKGKDGKTPVKGKDYFTEADVEEIAERAAEMVDVPEGGGTCEGAVLSVNGIVPDENGNVEVAGGVTSWNDLEDKPFGETLDYSNLIHTSMGKFKFSLIPDGRYSADANVGVINLVIGKSYRVEVSYMNNTVYCKFEGVCFNDNGILIIKDGGNVCSFDRLTGLTTISCTPLIAGFENAATSPMLFVKIYEAAEAIDTLDEKYIPDTIARTEQVTALINEALGVIENGTY